MHIPWGTRVPSWPRTEPRWNGAGREGTGSRRAPDWRKFAGKLTSDLDPVNSQQRVARRIARIDQKRTKRHCLIARHKCALQDRDGDDSHQSREAKNAELSNVMEYLDKFNDMCIAKVMSCEEKQ